MGGVRSVGERPRFARRPARSFLPLTDDAASQLALPILGDDATIQGAEAGRGAEGAEGAEDGVGGAGAGAGA